MMSLYSNNIGKLLYLEEATEKRLSEESIYKVIFLFKDLRNDTSWKKCNTKCDNLSYDLSKVLQPACNKLFFIAQNKNQILKQFSPRSLSRKPCLSC